MVINQLLVLFIMLVLKMYVHRIFNNEQAFWYTQHEVNTFFMSSDRKCSQSSISGRREKLHGKENPVSSMTFQKLMISNLRQQLRVECP